MILTPAELLRGPISTALDLLPVVLDTRQARAMMVAIALQESGLRARTQDNHGPARGFYQFEIAGVRQVLTHPSCTHITARFVSDLGLSTLRPEQLLDELAVNDVLASGFARLNLLPDPQALPSEGEWQQAWMYYLRTWHPGLPHPERWIGNYATAWRVAA